MMPKTIKQFIAGAAAAVLLCAAGCAHRKESEDLASRLARESELDTAYAEAYAAGYRDSALRDGKSEKEVGCVTGKITPETVRPVLVEIYSAEFSDEEMRQAISFFASATGKAYLRRERMVLRGMIGIPAEEARELTPPEAERVEAFLGTRIGGLMLDPQSRIAAATKEKMRPKFFAAFEQCKVAR